MRDIKFKAYHKTYKAVYDVAAIDFESKSLTLISGEFVIDDVEFNEVELMQFTGLKDKNRVDIYEGHACFDEHRESYGLVTFSERRFNYVWENISSDLFEMTDSIDIASTVYEKPELFN